MFLTELVYFMSVGFYHMLITLLNIILSLINLLWKGTVYKVYFVGFYSLSYCDSPMLEGACLSMVEQLGPARTSLQEALRGLSVESHYLSV